MAEEMNDFLKLNDDCLYEIFRLLNLNEQLILTDVCRRFRDVITEFVLKKSFKTLNTNDGLSEKLSCSKFRILFGLISNFIEVFEIDDMRHYVFSSYLGRFKEVPELDFYFCFDLPELRVLVCNEERFHDGHMKLISQKCPKLEDLSISTQYITGNYINNLTQLKVLKAPRGSLDAANLNAILSNLHHLEMYDVRNVESLDFLDNTTLTNLTVSVKLLNRGFGDHLENIENLKYLTISYKNTESHQPNHYWARFIEYIQQNAKQLELIAIKELYHVFKFLSDAIPIMRNISDMLQVLRTNQSANVYFIKVNWEEEASLELHCFQSDVLLLETFLKLCPKNSKIYFYLEALDVARLQVTIKFLSEKVDNDQFLIFYLVMKTNKKLDEAQMQFGQELFKELTDSSIYKDQRFMELKLEWNPPFDMDKKNAELKNRLRFIVDPSH